MDIFFPKEKGDSPLNKENDIKEGSERARMIKNEKLKKAKSKREKRERRV